MPGLHSVVSKYMCVFVPGYGIESDLKMIVKTFPSLTEAMMGVKRMVNLEVLAKEVRYHFKSAH